MDPSKGCQLVRQRGVAKIILSRMQTFIAAGDRKPNEIEVRCDELPSIFNKFETAQNELECSDDTDRSIDRQQFDDQYSYVGKVQRILAFY
jgi:hypothetical protein